MALILPNRYPGRFNPPSSDYPQGSFKNRTTPSAKDGSYLEQDWANDKEGFFQSLLSSASITANGSVDKVGSSQYYSALLALVVANSGKDYLNTARIDVVSASSINLTSSAPNTRHIRITGSASISGFTVAAGQCYFVDFSAGCSLIASSSIVTQGGGNITAVPGDSCILFATAANTVSVWGYVRASGEKGRTTAWVNFNGTGTVAIRDSMNVASITDGGVGIYALNFTDPMANTNYNVTFGVRGTTNGIGNCISMPDSTPKSTTALTVHTWSASTGTFFDATEIGVTIHGGK